MIVLPELTASVGILNESQDFRDQVERSPLVWSFSLGCFIGVIYCTREKWRYLQGSSRFGGKPLGWPMEHIARNSVQIKREKKLQKQDDLERIPK